MTIQRAARLGRTALLVAGLAWSAGCDKPTPARSKDTTAPTLPPPPPPESTSVVSELPWDTTAGPVMVVVGQNATQGSVIFPGVAADASLDSVRLDAMPYRGARFDLLGNGRVITSTPIASIASVDVPEDCSAWPTVQFGGAADSSGRGWVVGFEAGRVIPLAFDSIAGLASRDSSQLAIQIARVASGVPGDTVPELKGLPYQVRRAYRFAIAPGVEGVLAEVQRTLNQEASPKQEHILLLAERDSASGGRLEAAYVERSSGGEDMLETFELLTIARFASGARTSAVVARYLGDGVIYSLLERTGARRWRLRWTSPYAGC